jgi:hypothetical protein
VFVCVCGVCIMKLPGEVYYYGWFSNPDLTSHGGLPRRVHFCVPAHDNSINKPVCLDWGLGLEKSDLERVLGVRVVRLSFVWCVCCVVLCCVVLCCVVLCCVVLWCVVLCV